MPKPTIRQSIAILIKDLKKLSTLNTNTTAERRGIPEGSLIGVPTSVLRKRAKTLTASVELAEALYDSEYYEARILGILCMPTDKITNTLLKRWAGRLDSWSLCDLFAKHLAIHSPSMAPLINHWLGQKKLYQRRVALALLANHCMRREAMDAPAIEQVGAWITQGAVDDRLHVKNACCWALRELGKINDACHAQAIATALELIQSHSQTQRWVGNCAYGDLQTLVQVSQRRRLISRKTKTGRGSTEH